MTLNKFILMPRTKKNTKVVEQPEQIVETVKAVETESQIVSTTDNNRTEYSLESHYRELIKNIDTRRREDLTLKKSLKKFVERTNRMVVRSAKTKKSSNPGKKRATGFGDKTPLPPEFAKLFNMTEELAYMVYVIDELILNENTNESTRSELNELKKLLVITTGDNYVGAAKKQLRENLQIQQLQIY